MLLVVDSLAHDVTDDRRRDKGEANGHHEHYEHAVRLNLELFGIARHRERRCDYFELEVWVASRLPEYGFVHELREEGRGVLGRQVHKRGHSELFGQVVRFIDEVRPVAVGLETPLESGCVDVVTEGFQDRDLTLEGGVHLGVIVVGDVEGTLVVERQTLDERLRLNVIGRGPHEL